jgi:uncharacterized protein
MDLSKSRRTRVRRHPERGRHDRETVYAILDEGFVCHLGFCAEGQPFVIPTLYGRAADKLIVHGSSASRTLRALRDGIEVSVAVTLVDGLVLAHSVFSHSMNYRSVVVFGRATPINGTGEKLEALRAVTEHLLPGRWDEARPPTDAELKQTLVLSLPLEEASAKVRVGPPLDEPDPAWHTWAGELPLQIHSDAPVAFPGQDREVRASPSVAGFRRRHLNS